MGLIYSRQGSPSPAEWRRHRDPSPAAVSTLDGPWRDQV